MEVGLPDGAVRTKPVGPLPCAEVRAALAATLDGLDQLDPRRREPLLAWLKAWEHHWPKSFREILGETGGRCLSRLLEAPVDPNRYLKLRRIAIENLAGLL